MEQKSNHTKLTPIKAEPPTETPYWAITRGDTRDHFFVQWTDNESKAWCETSIDDERVIKFTSYNHAHAAALKILNLFPDYDLVSMYKAYKEIRSTQAGMVFQEGTS